ncbi:MAG: molybdopterin-dependent oxidoreductase [Pseudomonadota bacterium]
MTTVRRQLTAHHWGAGVAEIENGVLKRVGPHLDDPDPSLINENIAGSTYGRARVLRPAVRKSYLENGFSRATRNRGEEPFVEVSWDQALDLVADELGRVRSTYGNGAIFGGSYGWASAGRLHHAQSQLKRFLNTAGGFVRSEGNYSYHAALILMPHIVGNFRDHVKEATRWTTVAAEGQLVVMFGGVPLRNAQVSGGGIARHTLKNDLLACKKAGVEFVNFSPLRTDAIEELEAEWLAPRPGSDTAIMMGLAHTILAEELHDREFLDRYTVGFDRFAAYLTGHNDGTAKTAEWASALSGIPAGRIRRLARDMAAKRTLICTAVGLQRADYGEQPLWMTVTLAAMLGQIGLPGGGYGIGYAADASIGTVNRPVPWPHFPMGLNPVSDYIPVAAIADMLLCPGQPYAFNGKTRTYPDIQLVWWAGGNPFHHHQDLNRLRQAFQKPETIIVSEINWTATARHADIVLPVASAMERSDFGAGNQDRAIIPMPKAVEPPGEAREEYWIYSELEKRLQLNGAFSKNRSSREWLEDMWDQLAKRTKGKADLPQKLDSFLAGGIVTLEDPEPNAVFLSAFRSDPEANPLTTPSGRIELFSETIDGFGYDDCPGHATWLPPREWLGDGKAKTYPLHLISGQPETRLHSQYDNGAFSLSKKVAGREPVLINSADAADRGIGDGDVVRLFNDRGECLAGAVVTDDVRAGVVFLWTGAWYAPDFAHGNHRDVHGNPNVLTHDLRTSSLSQGPAAQSALVQLERFQDEPPPVDVFDPPLANTGRL